MNIFPECTYAHQMVPSAHEGHKKDITSPGTESTDSWPTMWALGRGSMSSVRLTRALATKSSLQLSPGYFVNSSFQFAVSPFCL